MCAIAGCTSSARTRALTPSPNDRVEAVVGFGPVDSAVLYALRDRRRLSWSFAPAIRVPAPDIFTVNAVGSAEAAQLPLVVLLRGRAGEPPYVEVSLLEAGAAVPGIAVAGELVAHPCLGESWLAAFFVEGLGPRPLEPVVIHYTTEERTYRFSVDPARHTLRAPSALSLKHGDADADPGLPDRRYIWFEPSPTLKPVLPLVLRRDREQWEGGGSSERGTGNYGFDFALWTTRARPSPMHRPHTPIEEWRVYLLETPPRC